MARELSQSESAVYHREYRKRKRLERDAAREGPAPPGAVQAGPPDAGRLIDWIHDRLKVPFGRLAGKPFVLADWQIDWVVAALDPAIQEAGLSISRKNGKSGLIAAVLLGALCGPLNRTAWRGVVASLTGKLAIELRDAVQATAEVSGLADQITLIKSPTPGVLLGKHGAKVDILAADKATGHAIGSDLAIIDEAGLLQENRRELWNALFSSISGRDGKLWAISIQGNGPMFEEMEQRAGSPGLHWRKWTSDPECALDDEAAWHSSNPG